MRLPRRLCRPAPVRLAVRRALAEPGSARARTGAGTVVRGPRSAGAARPIWSRTWPAVPSDIRTSVRMDGARMARRSTCCRPIHRGDRARGGVGRHPSSVVVLGAPARAAASMHGERHAAARRDRSRRCSSELVDVDGSRPRRSRRSRASARRRFATGCASTGSRPSRRTDARRARAAPQARRRSCDAARPTAPRRTSSTATARSRCSPCRAEAVIRRRAPDAAILVAEAGGACALCGYSAHPAALQFHHVDPATKAFTLRNGDTRSLARMRAEAAQVRPPVRELPCSGRGRSRRYCP